MVKVTPTVMEYRLAVFCWARWGPKRTNRGLWVMTTEVVVAAADDDVFAVVVAAAVVVVVVVFVKY